MGERWGSLKPLRVDLDEVAAAMDHLDRSETDHFLDLERGDVLAISSDGLPEATDFNDEPFGRARSRQAVLEACRRGDSAEGIGKHQLWEMRRFAGLQTRCDDLTLVTIKVQ